MCMTTSEYTRTMHSRQMRKQPAPFIILNQCVCSSPAYIKRSLRVQNKSPYKSIIRQEKGRKKWAIPSASSTLWYSPRFFPMSSIPSVCFVSYSTFFYGMSDRYTPLLIYPPLWIDWWSFFWLLPHSYFFICIQPHLSSLLINKQSIQKLKVLYKIIHRWCYFHCLHPILIFRIGIEMTTN